MTPRARDLALLRALIASSSLSFAEDEAFVDMLSRIDGAERRFDELTQPQRTWVESRAAQLEIDVEDPAERNRNVPRGNEVAPAPALLRRPLKPPPRRPP